MTEIDGPIVHIIDDDAAVRESLEALLTVLGYSVETYGSAEAYLERSEVNDGCVLLDVHMPGMNGLDLLRELARRRRRSPVLILTASRDERLRDHALELGAVAFLTKPVTQARLLAALREAISA
jgi:FixJ family two-component response regulator